VCTGLTAQAVHLECSTGDDDVLMSSANPPPRPHGAADSAAQVNWRREMAATCQVTGAVPGFGHNVSHSNRRTKRRFNPNIQKKRYYVPSLRKTVTLTVSAKGMKVIDARGIDAVVTELIAKGVKL